MKKICLVFAFFIVVQASGQTNADRNFAAKVADKMRDSLQLSPVQRDQIFAINMQLGSQKMAVRKQHSSRDSLTKYIQNIEDRRDSLYRQVLTVQQYRLYKKKKRFLVTNN